LDCLRSAQTFFANCYEGLDPATETLWIAHLDNADLCVHLSRHDGDPTSAPFPLKGILRDAIELNSAGILLAHNHPSGDPRPSEADLAATRRLFFVSEALDCKVLDHLVLAGDECTSFKAQGLL
jgi:DNA repair protein RadC